MNENKKRIEILERLNSDGFLRKEDYEDKLNQLIGELDENDLVEIENKEKVLKSEDEKKGNQLDYFTMLLKKEPGLLGVMYKNFLIS